MFKLWADIHQNVLQASYDLNFDWGVGWPDWVIFLQLGYFWRPIMIFWKEEVAQSNEDILGKFLFEQVYCICT
jgi:hypothetical protein